MNSESTAATSAESASLEALHSFPMGETWAESTADAVLSYESRLRSLGPDLYQQCYGSDDTLTGRWLYYNLLDLEIAEIDDLREVLYDELLVFVEARDLRHTIPDNVLVKMWANVWRMGEGVMPHTHIYSMEQERRLRNKVSGTVFLKSDRPCATHFKDADRWVGVDNVPGAGLLFDPNLAHEVRPHPGHLRVSIGLDVRTTFELEGTNDRAWTYRFLRPWRRVWAAPV